MSQLPPGYSLPSSEINDTHKKYDVAIAIIVLLVFTTLITVVRLWHQWKTRLFGSEDWSIIPALLLYIGHSIMGVYCNLNGGIGKPLWEVTYGEFQVWYKGLTGTTFLYPAMTGAVRVSILLFYYRIFGTVNPTVRWAVRIMLALTACYVIIYSIMPGFICRPIRLVWMLLERTPENCNSNEWYYQYTVSLYAASVAFDVILLTIPIVPVWNLQTSWQKRVGAIAMFSLGASSCVAAAYKLGVFVQQWGRIGDIDPRWATNIFSLLVPPQFDDYGYTFWVPSQVEPTTALIGSCLPAMRRVAGPIATQIKSTFSSITSSLERNKSANTNQYSTQDTAVPSLAGVYHPFSKISASGADRSSVGEPRDAGIELQELGNRT